MSIRRVPADVRFLAPAVVQTMSGKDVQPMITTPSGGIVLGAASATGHLYVLGDPDLLNNHGMGDERRRARRSRCSIISTAPAPMRVLFDVTANGLGRSRSPLKLAFDPPFLAVTLTIFAAMLLAAWQALVRFGPVRRRERAIAFGKAALVDNSAALIRKAGREAHLGGRYVEVIRERAVALFRLPATLDAAGARRTPRSRSTRIAASQRRHDAASSAQSRDELLGAAQSLNQWLEEVQR